MIKISNTQHGPIALHPFRSDKDAASTPLELREIAAARDFTCKITRTTLGHAKGAMLHYEIILQPLFELYFEENTDKAKLLILVEGKMALQLSNAETPWELVSGQCAVFNNASYYIFHSCAEEVKFLLMEIDSLGECLSWTSFQEGVYTSNTQMKNYITAILHPPSVLPFPGEWLTIQLLNVLMCLRQMIHLLQADQPGRISHFEYLMAADDFIRSNLHRTISIKEICMAVGLYETGLKEAFSKYFDKGMIGRHQELRIEKVKQMLQFTNKTINEIAVECGYGSEGTLREHFFNATGEKPNRWRQKQKK